MDFAAFRDASFDPKAWVNKTLAARGASETIEAHASNVVGRLQLISRDVATALADASAQCAAAVPKLLRDVQRIVSDVENLKHQTKTADSSLAELEGRSSVVTKSILSVDMAQQRAERCRILLSAVKEIEVEAANADRALNTRDGSAAANHISKLQSYVAAASALKGASDWQLRLHRLRDRLQQQLAEPFRKAILENDAEAAQRNAKALQDAGAGDAALNHYWQCREQTLRLPWKSYEGSQSTFVRWLPSFIEKVLSFVTGEVLFARKVFDDRSRKQSDDGTKALAQLLINAFSSMSAEFKTRIGSASLAQQVELFALARDFASSLLTILSHASIDIQKQLVLAVTEPFAHLLDELPRYVRNMLSNVMTGLRLGDNSTTLSVVASRVDASTRSVLSAASSALDYCGTLTGGVAAQALFNTLNDALADYAARLTSTLDVSRNVPLEDEPDADDDLFDDEEQGTDWAKIQASLQLMQAATSLSNKVHEFNDHAKSACAQWYNSLFVDPKDSNPHFLRLQTNQRRMQQLRLFLPRSRDEAVSEPVLALGLRSIDAFQAAVRSLVRDTLLQPMRSALDSLPAMEIWATIQEEPLPAYSITPQPYITRIGERLLMLPQQLEPLAQTAGRSADVDTRAFAQRWLTEFANDACHSFVERICAVQQFSADGRQQLTADVEYFINVLSALSVEPDRALVDALAAAKIVSSQVGPLGVFQGGRFISSNTTTNEFE
eukprot:TRINITY_DN1349_c0_g1_i1.p1 TRINITY_DN1349_c0_g1~~TRINITY_DN1349_c0_g1_i1.p1  ORF type:complete len:725 (+),score=171.35 TRINITY_DN1349_c0_g1_i1:105-2279(+)